MPDPKVSTLDDLFVELDSDAEFRRQSRRLKPYFDAQYEILKRRRALGLSQKALASRAGTHQSCVSRIESAEHDFRLSTLISLAEALESRVELELRPIHRLEEREYQELFSVGVSAGKPQVVATLAEDFAKV